MALEDDNAKVEPLQTLEGPVITGVAGATLKLTVVVGMAFPQLSIKLLPSDPLCAFNTHGPPPVRAGDIVNVI